MSTWRKVGCCLAMVAGLSFGAQATVRYVDAKAAGTGDGTSWENAYTDLRTAIASGADELWVAEDAGVITDSAALTVSKALTIRGGFKGVETSAAEREPGVISTYDGKDVYDGLKLSCSAAPKLTVERIHFTHCLNRAFQMTATKNGSAGNPITFNDCVFSFNGTNSTVEARCLYYKVSQSHFSVYYGALVANRCVFEDNVCAVRKDAATTVASGCITANFTNGGITLTDCVFRRNGLAPDDLLSDSKLTVAYPAVKSSILSLTRCKFIANRTRGVNGLVSIGSGTVKGCVFAGNEEYGTETTDGANGCLAASGSCTIENCTFAYNVSCSKGGAAAFNGKGGTSTVRNCLFFGNVVADGNAGGADVRSTGAAGIVNLDYSAFRVDDVMCLSGDSLFPGENITTVPDAYFVTDKDDFLDLLVTAAGATKTLSRATAPFHLDYERADEIDGFDVHVRSVAGYFDNTGAELTAAGVYPKSIDAGDPDSDRTNEPSPNGDRINLGAYGNTTEATKTPQYAQPVVTADDVTVTFADARYNQPTVVVEMGAEHPDDVYLAAVTICAGTGDGTEDGTVWSFSKSFANVQDGDVLTWTIPDFLDETAGQVCVKVVVDAGGDTEIVTAGKQVDPQGVKPYWAGHHGPDNVIHVFPYATGKGDGTTWTDAFTDLRQALLHVNGRMNEVWVSTNVAFDASFVETKFAPANNLTIRGGFTGAEDALEDRPEKTLSTYDGGDTLNGLIFQGPSGTITLTIERFHFMRCRSRAIEFEHTVKNNPSPLVVRDCVFSANGTGSTSVGKCIYYRSNLPHNNKYYGTLTVSNCIFEDNVSSAFSATAKNVDGCCIYQSFTDKSATIENCIFRRNGVAEADLAGENKVTVNYPALVGKSLVLTGCLFTENRTRCVGGVVSCSLVTAKNCLFARNVEYGEEMAASGARGALYASGGMSLENCTFAYNTSCANVGAAAANVGGAFSAVNSIFYGNALPDGAAAGRDVQLTAAGASVSRIAYTLFTENSAKCVNGVNGATIPADAGNIFRNPGFYSQTNFHLRGSGGYVDETTGEKVAGMGRRSPAIDAGDPGSDCSNEPEPNGGRINLGCYGNTAYASLTPKGGMALLVR